MKLSKSQLKGLIKECLVEILAEGLGSDSIQEAVKHRPRSVSKTSKAITKRNNVNVSKPNPTPQLKQAVQEIAQGDEVWASILADTANTTLREQTSAEDSTSGSGTEQFNASVEDVFGSENVGDNGHWAQLAFDSTPKSSIVPPPPAPLPNSINLDVKVSDLNKHV